MLNTSEPTINATLDPGAAPPYAVRQTERGRPLALAFTCAALGALVGGCLVAAVLLLAAGNVKAISASLAALDGSLNLRSKNAVNVTAGHVRLVGKDGNFEFEHGSQTDVSRLNSYYAGTGTRTPVAVGGADGQDVVALIAQASPAQKRDIQQWLSGSKVALAVDSKGRLRFGNITIWAAPRGGKIALYAQLQGAAPHVLASTVG